MSGGAQRGEIRIRKARPVDKGEGGTHNRNARRALRDMFCLPPHERITAIEIGTLGITARIARTQPKKAKGASK